METSGSWSTICQYAVPTVFSFVVASIGMTASSKSRGILALSFDNHILRRGFPSVPDPLQTIASQATKVGSDLASEATRVTDQANSIATSAAAVAGHLANQLLPRSVTLGTAEACFDFSNEKCYGFRFVQILLWLCAGFFVLACAIIVLTHRRRRSGLHFLAFGLGILAWVSSLVSAFVVIIVYWTAEKARRVGDGTLKKGLVFDLVFATMAVTTVHLFVSFGALLRLLSTGA
ncbi:hypothetical protein NLG97_g7634 [Lecanicillium saksenae]|uniref:Uncharacterized protein n=1 Tax=Lecanicillium saksenae TaxID=468837 RepID=A0ACC1QMT6_9HYPO|nr:hypothetical protein NLG97_g7634 [Lecanicillium saksenae]